MTFSPTPNLTFTLTFPKLPLLSSSYCCYYSYVCLRFQVESYGGLEPT